MARKKLVEESMVETPVMVEAPKTRRSVLERLAPLMWLSTMALSFVVGSYWTKVKYLEQLATNPPQAAQQQQQPQQVQVTKDQIKKIFSENVIKFGSPDAKLLLVEVADPSCPYCHAAAGHNGTLSKQMGTQFILTSDGGTYVSPVQEMKKLADSGKAAFAWIYSNGHGNGEVATNALYCAHDQGKFWPAHDKLMSAEGYDMINTTVKNDKSKNGTMVSFLGSLVDQKALKDCMDSGKYASRLTTEQSLARSLGVSGTPGFFVNEQNFPGAYSWNDMKTVAEAAL